MKKTKKNNYDDTKNMKLRVDEFSSVETEVYMSPVGIDIAREGATSNIDGVFLAIVQAIINAHMY